MSLWCSGQGVACTGSIPGDAVFCFFVPFFFFSCSVSFFNTIFPFGLFFFILTADPTGHALGSIYILSLSPEFYFGKGIWKALGLHTGQAYDQIKTISCQDMSLLWNSWIFSMLVDIMTNNTQYTQHPPVTHWRKLNLPFVHRLNHQYYYPKISTGFAPQNQLNETFSWFSGFSYRITGVCPIQYLNTVKQ